MTTEFDPLGEAISAISKLKLTPEDGLKLAKIVSVMYGNAPATPIAEPASATTSEPVAAEPARRKRGTLPKNIMNVSFGSHLRRLVEFGPQLPKDLIEPLREQGSRLATNNEIALKQVITGFKKSPNVYREHAEGKWGLLSYPPTPAPRSPGPSLTQ